MILSLVLFFFIILKSTTANSGLKLNPISVEENAKIQRHCGNPHFSADQGFKADPLLIGGKPAERGAYPWAVVLLLPWGSFCQGTLISPRHVITAEHCIASLPKRQTWWIQVGGVCKKRSTSNGCPEMDMTKVSPKRVFFTNRAPCINDDGNENEEECVEYWRSDFAIIELDQDVKAAPFFSTAGNAGHRIEVGCLSQQPAIPCEVHLYGWGKTQREFDENDTRIDSVPATHLMEIRVPVVNGTERPYKEDNISKMCFHADLFCTRDNSLDKVAASGDSGTGVVGYHGGQPFIDGMHVASHDKRMAQYGVEIRMWAYRREICFYTGVCNRPEWAKENSRWYNDDGFHRLDKKYIYRGKPPPEEEEERWRRSLTDNEIREI